MFAGSNPVMPSKFYKKGYDIISMYNMMHGRNPLAGLFIGMLGLDANDFGRFRDCYLNGDEIVVYTRCGGGNREEYETMFETMSEHENYLRDEDDDFDSTYASIYFSIPPQHEADIIMIKLAVEQETTPPEDKWKEMMTRLGHTA